jgi:glycogen synthase
VPPPSISVVISAFTFDRLEILDEGIGSLLEQTVAPREVLVVIDYQPELLEACRERWPGVRVIPNEGERGLCGARNTGIASSESDVVAFLDDDAVPSRGWIQYLGESYAEPDVLGVGGAVNPRWQAGRPSWFPPEFDWVVGCTHSGMPKQREPVRNMIGANMSFRREVLLEVGGFRHEFSRIDANGAGADETDLCIRTHQRWPGRTILFEPQASVEHLVPPSRGELGYFTSRCRGEGRSKAILTEFLGADDSLESERSYVRRTLPVGFLRGFGDALKGEPAGLARSATMAIGLAVTGTGFIATRRQRARAAVEAAPDVERLRVLMVTPRSPLGQGGVERHVLEVSRRLAAAGEQVEVISAEPGGPALAEERRDGVEFRSVRAWPANRDYYLAPRIWREMSRRRPDIVHVQSYHTLVAPLAMLRALAMKVPYVVTFHGGGHSSGLRNRSRRLQRALLKPLLSRAARLVAVARFEVEQYGQELGLPPERFVVIPNGTELTPSAAPPARNGLPPTLATVGRLERYKGHHLVLDAFAELLRERPEARLLVVGSGPYEQELRERAAELRLGDSVEFTSVPAGDAEAMAALLGRVSLVVLMSEFETHPLVALEAAAAGCKLLVADAGGLAELAAEGLARAVPLDAGAAEVARAAGEELDKPARSVRPSLISWDESAARLDALYREVLGAASAPVQPAEEPVDGAAPLGKEE